eukprot:TRINITY_DN16350_c0_g1_i2.p1 TRINITY_DN16350_c0_g1~~TRINITY_DN16350_c0_g1_i2.p1  ORF type:complete len:623 (+),score=232.67 TRINITY_DN16350_c0_g1_i2:47-1915(+)
MAYPGAKMSGTGEGPPVLDTREELVRTWHVPAKQTPMMRYQSSLPRLPVPPLEQSLKIYLNSVRPLCNEEEWKRTKEAAIEFLTSGLGDELHERLLKRAAEKSDSSWLVDWWNELSYFGYRDPVVVYVSYFYQFVADTWSGMKSARRAAGYIKAALRYRDLIMTEQLPPEMSGKSPQDMSMYKYLFNAIRIPKKGKDYYATFDGYRNTHVVVLRKGKIYTIETRQNGAELSLDELVQQVEKIIAMAGQQTAANPVGLLTSENRDTWAAAREHLVATGNEKQLHIIDSSVMALCLDDCTPQSIDETARTLWHGDGMNRWFDKPLQFIVADNGEAGFCGEHGIMDGTPTLRCVDWVLDALASGPQKVEVGKGVGAPLAAPEEIVFKVDTKTSQSIRGASAAFKKLVSEQELRVLDWKHFGKNGIKKLKVSPDAFCQMAVQLAYKRLTGKFGATYEACSTRGFLHGRTETIRSLHTPGAKFVAAMDSAATAKQKYSLLQKAANHQAWYARMAAKAQGCDRHLMGLKLLCKENEKPALFSDPMYSYSSSWVLSTSALASEHFATWGFGEVVPNGYGVGYLCNQNNLSFTLTSRTDLPLPASALHAELSKALSDMHDMCKAALSAKM